jgi:hypothetical protein
MLAEDPALAAEAAEQRNLIDKTRSLANLEPTDSEMRRFWASFAPTHTLAALATQATPRNPTKNSGEKACSRSSRRPTIAN